MEEPKPKYDLDELAKKWLSGTISPEERAYFEAWYGGFDDENVTLQDTKYTDREQLRSAMLSKINRKIRENAPKRTVLVSFPWARIAAAATIILLIGVGVTLWVNKGTQVEQVVATSDIAPGGNKAILTLADGSKVALIDAAEGEIARQAGMRVRKTAEGELVYSAVESDLPSRAAAVLYNTIETPRGGQYQVVLPDGSKVWLNAASSLRYPASFDGLAVRRVDLVGEAYFEVARDQSKPFLVASREQTVKVLGTHFNVSVYPDDQEIRTTLLEGKVQVVPADGTRVLTLSPGDQAIRAGDGFRVLEVDAEEAIAWKNGVFVFSNEPLESILRKVARWYDVEVVYEDAGAAREVFWGSVSRFENASEVLSMLEQTGNARFTVEGRKIIVQTKIQ